MEAIPPEVTALLEELMQALNVPDANQSAQQVAQLVHASLLGPDGALEDDVRKYSFKKAHDHAQYYAVPVKVTRVRVREETSLGDDPGKNVDYFIAKKDESAGLPAPVQVFFPDGGAAAVIAYLGSL